MDIDEFVGDNLLEVSDWELNFKMLKAAAKDADKLPNEVRLDIYRVSLLPLKAAIDEQMKKMKEALGSSLRKKVGFAGKARPASHCRSTHGVESVKLSPPASLLRSRCSDRCAMSHASQPCLGPAIRTSIAR